MRGPFGTRNWCKFAWMVLVRPAEALLWAKPDASEPRHCWVTRLPRFLPPKTAEWSKGWAHPLRDWCASRRCGWAPSSRPPPALPMDGLPGGERHDLAQPVPGVVRICWRYGRRDPSGWWRIHLVSGPPPLHALPPRHLVQSMTFVGWRVLLDADDFPAAPPPPTVRSPSRMTLRRRTLRQSSSHKASASSATFAPAPCPMKQTPRPKRRVACAFGWGALLQATQVSVIPGEAPDAGRLPRCGTWPGEAWQPTRARNARSNPRHERGWA